VKIETVLIADAASTSSDGKLNMLGGGITRLNVPALPWNQTFALVIRAHVDAADLEETTRRHHLAIDLQNPGGRSMLPVVFETPVDQEALRETARRLIPGEQHMLHLILAFQGAPITETGTHSIVVRLDGEEVWRISLPVVLVPADARILSPEPPPA
jgi:hypothetical protein